MEKSDLSMWILLWMRFWNKFVIMWSIGNGASLGMKLDILIFYIIFIEGLL